MQQDPLPYPPYYYKYFDQPDHFQPPNLEVLQNHTTYFKLYDDLKRMDNQHATQLDLKRDYESKLKELNKLIAHKQLEILQFMSQNLSLPTENQLVLFTEYKELIFLFTNLCKDLRVLEAKEELKQTYINDKISMKEQIEKFQKVEQRIKMDFKILNITPFKQQMKKKKEEILQMYNNGENIEINFSQNLVNQTSLNSERQYNNNSILAGQQSAQSFNMQNYNSQIQSQQLSQQNQQQRPQQQQQQQQFQKNPTQNLNEQIHNQNQNQMEYEQQNYNNDNSNYSNLKQNTNKKEDLQQNNYQQQKQQQGYPQQENQQQQDTNLYEQNNQTQNQNQNNRQSNQNIQQFDQYNKYNDEFQQNQYNNNNNNNYEQDMNYNDDNNFNQNQNNQYNYQPNNQQDDNDMDDMNDVMLNDVNNGSCLFQDDQL